MSPPRLPRIDDVEPLLAALPAFARRPVGRAMSLFEPRYVGAALPHHAYELLRLTPLERALHRAIVAAHLGAGLWHRNARRRGDVAEMGWLDVAYWIHKTRHPVAYPARGEELRGLEEPTKRTVPLPPGFRADDRATLAAAGDLMMHPFLRASGDHLYDAIAERLFGADLTLANLEAVLQPDEPLPPARDRNIAPKLDFDPPAFRAIVQHGARSWSFLSLANNHILDHGPAVATQTRDELDRLGIAHHGLNVDRASADRPTILEARGIRIAVLSWTFGLNGRLPPPDAASLVNHLPLNEPGPWTDSPRLRAQLAAARRDADFVVASLHWGMEFERYPRPAQQAHAHALAELGVDLIFGHHPHVVQPCELYRPHRDPDRIVPIFYSLGNLTNPCAAPFMADSLVAHLELSRGRSPHGDRRTYVSAIDPQWVRQRADTLHATVSLIPTEANEVLCPS